MVQKEGEASLPSDAPSPLLLGDCSSSPVSECYPHACSSTAKSHSSLRFSCSLCLCQKLITVLFSSSRMPSQSVLSSPFLIAAELTWMPSFGCSPPGSSPLPSPCVSCSESATVQLRTMVRLLSLSRLWFVDRVVVGSVRLHARRQQTMN